MSVDTPTGTRTGFSAELWEQITPSFEAILAHPFLTGILDASLEPERFVYFIEQDGLYLRAYSRALSYTAGHAERPADTALFTSSASRAIAVEQGMHAELLEGFGVDPGASRPTGLSPSGALYVNSVLRHTAAGPFSRAVASVLACFWIYAEVGKVLIEKGSSDPRYQRWIDTYGDPQFAATVDAVLEIVDRLGTEVGDVERDRMATIFREGCRMEWMFWDAAWRGETWPMEI
jgi:thiaminase/transcriptional activator TenA